MKALVLFDSNFGNTQKIAEVIAKELEAKAISISTLNVNDLEGVELLVVGSPIIGWKPSENMAAFLSSLKSEQLKGVQAATFDTRVKLFIHGDAMTKIADELKRAGAQIIAKSSAFYVKGKEGPLLDGEIEKAANWAKSIEAETKTN